MGIKARDMNVNLEGLKIDVSKEMVNQPYRRVSKLTLNIQYPKRYDDKIQEILNNVVKICPVSRSLSSEVEFVVNFSYQDE
jgi:uncharacterized OsmC-like protein